MKMEVTFEVDLSDDEYRELEELCRSEGVDVREKLGALVHGFVVAEGVKHRLESA